MYSVCHIRPVAHFTLGKTTLCLAKYLNGLFGVNFEGFPPPPEVDSEKDEAKGGQNDSIIKGRGHRKVDGRRE